MDKVKRVKNLFKALQKDQKSVLFGSEQITCKQIRKVRKSKYEKDNVFYKLYSNIGEITKNSNRTYNS